MEKYVYPALFHLNKDDGSYTITYPDLPGCISEGKSLENALYMAQDALRTWIGYMLDEGMPLPVPSAIHQVRYGADEFVSLVRTVVRDGRAVRRTVSIPKWMDDQVSAAGISLSKVLQEALSVRFSAE